MTISIITATYNSAATIRDTLESIKIQNYPYIEHIIVDGASKDETLDIVSEFPHVSKVISERDKGIYDAMNKGVSNSSGVVIGILNSDDFYAEDSVIEDVMAIFDKTNVDAVYGDLKYVSENNTSKIVRHWKAKEYNKKSWLFGWMPPHPSFFVRKEYYEKFGMFNLDLSSAADYELMLRFCFKNSISVKYIPKTLVHMRTGGQSNASFMNRFRANREDRLAWKLNQLEPYFFTIFLKPLRKVVQYFQSPFKNP